MKFRVFDSERNDVTEDGAWYIGTDGTLYYETTDIDCPLQEAEDYTYEMVED